MTESKATASSTSQDPLPTGTETTDRSVTSPPGVVRDCWNANSDGATFKKTACTSSHVYEVFGVRTLTLNDFTTAKKATATETPDAWAARIAEAYCKGKYSPKILAAGVKDADVNFSSIYPTSLSATDEGSWDGAEFVCLLHLDGEKPVAKRLLK